MEKLSSIYVADILSQVPIALRALAEENAALKEKVAFHEKRDRVERIAALMEQKNIEPETTFSEKVASLMERENLDTIEEAINMVANQVKVASLSDDPGNSSNPRAALEAFILS